MAKVRKCPKGCAQPFCKSEGCNKMTCPTCKSFICYVCRALIPKNVGYKHFCQTPHCKHESCNLCPLYSNAEEDDKRAAKEAGLKTVEQIRMEQRDKGHDSNGQGVGDATTKIDIAGILKTPSSNNNNNRNSNHMHHMQPPGIPGAPIGILRNRQHVDDMRHAMYANAMGARGPPARFHYNGIRRRRY